MPKPRAKGGGRKPAGDRAGVSHATRPELSSRNPVHVTLTTVPEVGFLRKRKVLKAVQRASVCSGAWSAAREVFRICHVSLQGNHIHLLVEAENKKALSRGMQGFMISCAKRINRLLAGADGQPRRGRVFADRYHSHILTSPREVRRALSYVLNNWRHHGFHRGTSGLRLDPYATGYAFNGWSDAPPRERYGERDLLLVWHPRTWLLATGWKRHGLVPTWEVPG
jgi:REP element-mobilizing transposase RayT